MALEIQEIGIQLRVDDEEREDGDRRGDGRKRPPAGMDCGDEEQRQALVDDCVERVLAELERRRRR